MTYDLYFNKQAAKEWDALNNTVRDQFKKKLTKILESPRIPSAALSSMTDCYKIKLRQAGFRLVYRVDDGRIVVVVIAVGKRDKGQVYDDALGRL